jgi:hypothetical protein
VVAGPRAEDQELGEGVGAEAVGAVDRNACRLAGRVEPRDLRGAVRVGVDASHAVVHHGPDGDRILHRIDPDVFRRQLPNEGEALVDLLLAEVAQIEVHVVAVFPLEGPARLHLLDEGAREEIARPQLHLIRDVALEVPLAFLVEEIAPLRPRRLSDEDPGSGQSRGMVLDELHVLHRHADPVGQRHPVARLDAGVRREGEDTPRAARADDHRPGVDGAKTPAVKVKRGHAAHRAVGHEERGDELFVVADDTIVLE